ncbi:hypothetical protein REPUB_Repub01dG0056900 [Reevesia pubescens]
METNHGRTMKLKVYRQMPTSPPVFERFYICFQALKLRVQNYCRHFLGLDGCWLKSLTKRELLVAIGRDGNNKMFLVTWALVKVECTAS